MTALTTPKGPLPPRVYWVRRVLLLSVVFLLVFGIARVLGGGSDAKSDPPKATRAAASSSAGSSTGDPASPPATPATSPATSSATDTAAPPSGSPPADPGRKKKRTKASKVEETPEAPVMPTPTGVCTNEDVAIAPTADGATAGGQVQFLLNLRTKVTPACTWQVSADTLTLKITSGDDDIWASRECRKSIPTQDVTLYKDYDTTVPVVWSGRRSDEECSKLTEWAAAGWYHLFAATYAGEPVDVQFELGVPAPVTVTKTAEPPKDTKGKKKGDASPSGAVEPNGG
ncbi:hypothetical protein [Nocardioides sp. LHG3406-4]|uniref:hypothetical protein n=1 Tax=Nocardioides sp. LHG3406-4 TaxID=2804575 RepID=UPI003CF7F608